MVNYVLLLTERYEGRGSRGVVWDWFWKQIQYQLILLIILHSN